jgi:hypothetical protein
MQFSDKEVDLLELELSLRCLMSFDLRTPLREAILIGWSKGK